MPGYRLRLLGLGLFATAGSGLLALTAVMNSAFAYGGTPPPLLDPGPSVTELMGATGLPIPSTDPFYVDSVEAYIQTFLPGSKPVELFTPEGLYPLTGVKTLPFDTSVSQGVTILNNAITPQLDANIPVGVLGVSQSADISSLEMSALDPAGTPSSLPAYFVLLGDEMNPNGGLLARFPGLNLASIGLPFYGSTPANDFPTVIVTHEYDGFADFCQYPIDVVCDVNAFVGMLYDHSYTAADIDPAFTLPTEGATETTYYMIPAGLPLTELLSAIPVIGTPIADLIGPDLTAIVNLGFGDPLYGYSTGPANIPTPFGLFPSVSDFEEFFKLLASGTETGIKNFLGAFSGHEGTALASLGSPPDPSSGSDPASLVTDFVNAVNTLSSDASTAYSGLLATADFANTLLTSLPAYDVELFVDHLSNPIDAIGLPIAADVGIGTLAGAFELVVLAGSLTGSPLF